MGVNGPCKIYLHMLVFLYSFTAQIVILNHPGEITKGYSPVVNAHTANVSCVFEELIAKIDKRTGKTLAANPMFLEAGNCALVKLKPLKPFYIDTYDAFPGLGRFAIRDSRCHWKLVAIIVDGCG